MEWKNAGFDWNRARAFLATVEEGSLSGAARALGQTQPTLGRQVSALERELGVTLFERVGNRLELTETGAALLEHVRVMREAALQLSLTATGQSEAVDGLVRVAASETLSAHLLPPVIAELRQLHPGIDVDIVASLETSDLRRREADIALRNYRPTDPELIAKKLRDSRASLYAAPAYLERIGRPSSPADLSEEAEIFAFDRSDLMIKGLNAVGYRLEQRNFPVRTGNHLVQWELCKRGVGICVMMEEVGEDEPMVERLLPEHPAPVSFPTWLTCHRELRTSRRIRVVFDLLTQRLTAKVAVNVGPRQSDGS
jgi:DNA-binding transcriptional LysR family regulator